MIVFDLSDSMASTITPNEFAWALLPGCTLGFILCGIAAYAIISDEMQFFREGKSSVAELIVAGIGSAVNGAVALFGLVVLALVIPALCGYPLT